MSPADMIKMASPKATGCFSAGSQSYNHILDLLENCHKTSPQNASSPHHDSSFFLKNLKELENACLQYTTKTGVNEKRKDAVLNLLSQMSTLKSDGYRYTTAREDGSVDTRNFNCKTKFAGTQETIACRHIALQEIFERQTEDLSPPDDICKAHRADRRTEQRGTLELMAQRMNLQLHNRYNEIKFGAHNNYVVDHSKWGQFFHEIFTRMTVPSTRFMLITSSNHSMTVRLRVKKPDPQGQTHYVINFHDPNDTLSDKRFYTDRLETVENLFIGDFLSTDCIKAYFGDPGQENSDQVSCFQEVPNDFHTRPLDEPRSYTTSDSRLVEKFLPEQQTFHPGLENHLLTANLPLDKLRSQLLNCPPEKVFPLLAAKNFEGHTGLFLALSWGNADAIKPYGQLVLDVAKKGLINKQQAFELLAARDNHGRPGICAAKTHGHAETNDAYFQIVSAALEAGLINKQQIFELLAAKNPKGYSEGYAELYWGHTDAIKAYGQLVLDVAKKDLINKQQTFELLAARDTNGRPGICAAKKRGHAETIDAHCQIILAAAEDGWIEKQQKDELLAGI